MNNSVEKRKDKCARYFGPTIMDLGFFADFLAPFEEDFDRFLGNAHVVPCDVVSHKDKNGVVTATEINYALAGYDKDNISIDIDGDTLSVRVEKTEETKDENKSYLHKGISRRKIEASYDIRGYDKEKISSSFIDGILKISLPVTESKEVKKIGVKINTSSDLLDSK